MNLNNVPTLLTAPNKTFKAPTNSSRRPSNFDTAANKTNNNSGNNSITSPLPRSPSLELSDSFSALSALSPTQTGTFGNIRQQQQNTKYGIGSHHNKSPNEYHHNFFSTTQLGFIKPICSSETLDNWSFLSLEKYPASHNPYVLLSMSLTSIFSFYIS